MIDGKIYCILTWKNVDFNLCVIYPINPKQTLFLKLVLMGSQVKTKLNCTHQFKKKSVNDQSFQSFYGHSK